MHPGTKSVLFINAHSAEKNEDPNRGFPANILYLASSLKKALGDLVKVSLIDLMRERHGGGILSGSLIGGDPTREVEEVEDLARRIKDEVDDAFTFTRDTEFYILVSCFSSLNYAKTINIIKAIHRLVASGSMPKPVILVGGYHATAVPQDFLNVGVDYVVKGEGELAVTNIVRNRGRFTLDAPAEIHQQPPAPRTSIITGPIMVEMDDLPLPDFSVFPHAGEYTHVALSLSRGCPGSCAYCMEETLACLKPKGAKWRSYSPARAKLEIETAFSFLATLPGNDPLRGKCKSVLGFCDPTFGYNQAWRDEVLSFLKEENPGFHMVAESRLDILRCKDIKAFKDANVTLVVGLESGSKDTLVRMKKTTSPTRYLERMADIAGWARDLGHHIVSNMVYNFPGDTRETVEESFSYLATLVEKGVLFNTPFPLYFLCPGDKVFSNMSYWEENYGSRFYYKEWWKDTSLVDFRNVIDPSKGFSFLESLELHRDGLKTLYGRAMDRAADDMVKRTLAIKRVMIEKHARDKLVLLKQHARAC
ncbi:MAG: cobalamin-dependent protein [Candidatus Lokiarchaeota archaeon]|nr:cobalamin-dependent protein [Candidatus Lokiarchaeota archaeon]